MSSDHDTARIVSQWLEDGENALPDRVLDLVLEEVPATPQRRHWWQGRNPFVNTMRLALTAGVVIAATFFGLGLLGNQGGLVGPPPPTPSEAPTDAPPTPTVEPTEAPTALSFAAINDRQRVPAGTYLADSGFPLRIVFTVPDGWAKWVSDEESVAVFWNFFNPPDGAALGFTLVGDVYADPCRWGASLTEVGGTVNDLAQALTGRPTVAATAPRDITLGGYAGKYLELTVPDDVSECDRNEVRHWASASGRTHRDNPGGGDRDRIWILDAAGVRLVIGAAYQPDTPPDVLAQLEEMVSSIRIEPVARDAP
jgi:hypothetical protein